jgi:chorismate synthase
VPAGLALDEEFIARDLVRRQGGYGRSARMDIEQDRAEILSGVRHGLTIGSPISLLIWNRDWENWQEVMAISPVERKIEPITRLRPGQEDIRPILERASARETAARVAVGAVARRFLEEFGIEIHSHTIAIGGVSAKGEKGEKAMMAAIDDAKEAGDTVGGVFQVVATGVPIGLGSHVHWDRRLDGRIAQAMMSINAVKGVEIGAGFALANLLGSQAHDIIQFDKAKRKWRHASNRGGGIEGGMTNGEPIVVNAVVKPIPTLGKPLPSVDLKTGEAVEAHLERSDVCVVPAAGVIGEAMLAIVLADALLEKFGGDHINETRRNYQGYLDTMTGGHGE